MPKKEDGLGLCSLSTVNDAVPRILCLAKLLTFNFLRIYLTNLGSPRSNYVDSSIWPALKSHFLTL